MARLVVNFYRLLIVLACLALVSAFACIMLGILARQFQWDLPGLDAYAGFAIAAALFLALPETLRKGEHIRVSLLLQRLAPAHRNALEYWCLTAGLALAAYLAWYALRLVWTSYLTHDVSPAADATPLWLPQSLMALGCWGLALAFVEALLARLRGRLVFTPGGEAEIARAE
ncbi:MAG: TRAP transporter small permease subunit [Betaproteobacteria bacterium]|nr:TRAP transporter small permease subunit [Betaproteobacteria bacterium]